MVDKAGRIRVRDWNGDIADKEGSNKNHDIIRPGIRANPNFQTKANNLKPVFLIGNTTRKRHRGGALM